MRKNNDTEFELITRINEGDTSAFKILVNKYKDVSFSLACSILKNEQDAEDALQEGFIKAYRGLKCFGFKSSFSTWLFKIIVNTCHTKYKYHTRNRQLIDFDSYVSIEVADKYTPLKEIDLKERQIAVNKVLNLIKEDESLLLRLFYLAELNINEIKEITGFKDSKIKVTLHRARKNFQLKLEKLYGFEITLHHE